MNLKRYTYFAVAGSLSGVIWVGACGSAWPHSKPYLCNRQAHGVANGIVAKRVSPAAAHAKVVGQYLYPPPNLYQTLALLWQAESSNGVNMVGDSDKAQGHFQHWECSWRDGCEALGADWPYSDANDLARAAAVTAANWARYAPEALKSGDIERMVRGHRKPCDPYGSGQDEYLAYVIKGGQ